MYKGLIGVIRILTLLICGLDVVGLENIPEKGGAVVAGNHTTWFDPFAMAIALKRPIHFMGKAELFDIPVVGWILSRVYVFPVRRGLADRDAIRMAQERVTQGNLLGIFPEGTRNKTQGELLPLQGGATLISIKTGVPVIPVVVLNVKPFGLRRPIKVVIGKPIDLGGPKKAIKADITQGNEMISAQFSSLLSRNS